MVKVFRYSFNFLAIVSLVAGVLAPRMQYNEEATSKVLGIATAQQLPIAIENLPVLLPRTADFESHAAAALAVDMESGRVLYEKNSSLKRPTASLAKLVTALVVTNLVSESEVVEVIPDDLAGLVQPVMGLSAGERITVADLLRGMLIMSANDAAAVLSRAASGSRQRFAQLMNDMGQQLGVKHAHFKNHAGFDEPGQYATAEDWRKITLAFLKNSTLASIVQTSSVRVLSVDQKMRHWLKNTNHLLQKDRIMGVKTGYTDEARGNLILLASDGQNHRVLTIVLGSERREEDSHALLKWIFESYRF